VPADEDPSRDAGPYEIERVYLLHSMPTLPEQTVTLRIEQGYLPSREGLMKGRIRRTVHPDGRIECVHTLKRGEGLVREERERQISQEAFRAEWPRSERQRIAKTRHEVREGGFVWQIDVFDEPQGLIMAEVELPTPESEAPPPAWLAPHIEREVTDDPSYTNRSIARRLGGLEE